MLMNRSAVLAAPGRIEMREEKVGRLSPGEALLEIQCAGVCGTDISIFKGDYPVPLPLVLGHEFSAVVVDGPKGSAAARLIGRRVVCEINNSCIAYGRKRLCAACRRGMSNHCLTRTVTGIINHPGGFAKYLRAPAGNLHPLPAAVASDTAILLEPLAAAIQTFEMTPLRGGETVVVLGCGRLGRLVALVASRLGARVIAVGRSPVHLGLIRPFAWKVVRLATDDTPSAGAIPVSALRQLVMDHTGGLGADVVVEATSANRNLLLAQTLVRPRGTVALKSTSGVPVDGVDSTMAAVHEICFQGSRCGPFGKAIRFMQKHGAPDSSWITARYPLDQTAQAIRAAMTEPKVLIEIA